MSPEFWAGSGGGVGAVSGKASERWAQRWGCGGELQDGKLTGTEVGQ